MSSLRALLLCAAALAAAPAHAQDEGSSMAVDEPPLPPPSAMDADSITVGLGAAYGPDYEGSDDYRFIPGALVRAKFGDVRIVTRGLRLYATLTPPGDGDMSFDAGPIVGVRLSRSGKVDDPVVDQLPDRDVAVELGGFAGLTFKGLTNPYDRLSFRLDAVHDVAGAHDDWLIGPNVDFSTPLSRKTFVALSLGAEIVGDDFAATYFGVTPAEAATVPALAPYSLDGGLKSIGGGLVLGQSLEDNLLEGFSLFGTVNYERLLGDFADSPLVADRGSANQWFLAAGVGYTF
ncbi:MipA/OmpV family protein [Sphingomicrobium lutaoense]|uniref:Outer membrane scaffolding protein for murein synthesis (MipA/OmpV family) n=1 Tax=Sphingomicrobium lutaoense TaxID=515949 RepID=A0A839Z0B4_9SPHN|nr:MipA/OmpV family protein [Sphingomicrobium lutaoense]MBB3764706.1 outer membrane scaffolding protein for murein synthesis (MipA/OmpV family) [Sphingomicrobium lutaoense]